ncbi:hypothetical protein SISNIDRAFT_552431 [Sistotremastrum niveocremeum HHB9708]|uniref:Uncharacterized protein n=1 Tax=Sistotremastrum niveocremeum HHB9708 TaxID=1314777 RepID=A0A164PKV7_9AGAM|nr:hypothetical protein SISNIDRAFT_552431 [Sistotremastrum niveocremeum HHB9708]
MSSRVPGSVRWDVTNCTRNLQIRTGITAALWSTLLVLFLLTLHTVLARFGTQSKVRIVLAMLIATFLVATVEFGLNIGNIASMTPTLITHPGDMICNNNDPKSLQVPMIIQMFIGDAFTVYRTWLLWDRKFLVVLFPAILLFVLIQWFIVFLSFVHLTVSYAVLIPVSLALNLICLILIGYRLYTHKQIPLPRRFIHMIISTGALYPILLFYLMITLLTKWEYATELAGPISITTVIAISLNLLVLQACSPGTSVREGMIRLPESDVGEPAGTDTTFPSDPIVDLILLG